MFVWCWWQIPLSEPDLLLQRAGSFQLFLTAPCLWQLLAFYSFAGCTRFWIWVMFFKNSPECRTESQTQWRAELSQKRTEVQNWVTNALECRIVYFKILTFSVILEKNTLEFMTYLLMARPQTNRCFSKSTVYNHLTNNTHQKANRMHVKCACYS